MSPSPEWSPLVRIRAGERRRRPLFCIHASGGHVVLYQPLAARLPAGTTTYGLQARGVDGVLPFHETIEDMADAYLRAIEAVDSAGPYRLAGYSGGGVVAFEIAQRIWRSGRQVELLAMFDTIASHAARTSLSLREKLQLSLHMPPRRLAKFAVERCKQHLQKQVASSMARGMDPIHRIAERAATAMIRARSRYDAEPYPGDLLLFRATNATMPYEHAGRALGWDRWVRGRIDVVPVRAWHETVLAVPAVDDLARSLAERLTDLDDRRANAVG